jgi:hypothetical protein
MGSANRDGKGRDSHPVPAVIYARRKSGEALVQRCEGLRPIAQRQRHGWLPTSSQLMIRLLLLEEWSHVA